MERKTKALLAKLLGLKHQARLTDWITGHRNVRSKKIAVKLGGVTGSEWFIWMAGADEAETKHNTEKRRQAFERWAGKGK